MVNKQQTTSFKWDEYGKLVFGAVETVQHQVDKNSDRIEALDTKSSNNTKYIITTILTVAVLLVGLIVYDIRSNRKIMGEMRKELTELKKDFGTVLVITRPDHIQALKVGYDTYVKRYFDRVSRGYIPDSIFFKE